MKKDFGIKILVAGKKHQDGIKNVKTETWLATYPNKEHGITKKDILDFWEARKKIGKKIKKWKGAKQWTALVDQQVVGHCIAERKEKFNEVSAIYILPKYQEIGIGGRLFGKAIDYLGHDKDIRIQVVSYNKNAIDFYKRFGFKENKRIKNLKYDLLDGKYMPMMILVKKFK